LNNTQRFLAIAFLLFFYFSALPAARSGELVEGIVGVITTENRNEKVQEALFLSDLERYHLFFQMGKEILSREEQLNRVINHRLLLTEARRFILDPPSKKAVESRLVSIRRRFRDEAHFQASLKKTGLHLNELTSEITGRLRVEKLIKERIKEFIFITPKAIEAYYQKHPNAFPGRAIEEVEPVIQSILSGTKERKKRQDYLDRLKEKARIERFLPQEKG